MSFPNRSTSGVVCVDRELLKSPAFRALNSANAVRVLFDFLAKRRFVQTANSKKRNKKWRMINNGEIEYTYKEANSRGMSNNTFLRAIDTLIEHGFIDIQESGAGVHKMKTLYWISERWRKWGTDDFIEQKRPKRTRLRKDIGFQKGHRFYPRNVEEN